MIASIAAQYRVAMAALKNLRDADLELRRVVPDYAVKANFGKDYTNLVYDVKKSFWQLVFDRTHIGEVTTDAYQNEFFRQQEKIYNMEFNEQTIHEVLTLFWDNRTAIMDRCIQDVFQNLTAYSRDNVVKSEQWATNKNHRINAHIIIPNAVEADFWLLSHYRRHDLSDLDKILQFFGSTNGVTTERAIEERLRRIRCSEVAYTERFTVPNFDVRVYAVGTLHLWFKDTKSLELLNRYAASKNMFALGSGK